MLSMQVGCDGLSDEVAHVQRCNGSVGLGTIIFWLTRVVILTILVVLVPIGFVFALVFSIDYLCSFTSSVTRYAIGLSS